LNGEGDGLNVQHHGCNRNTFSSASSPGDLFRNKMSNLLFDS
jgi:hypothetical protein